MSLITKRALKESLKKLMTKKSFNKITISDLTDDCQISRMTFYYHFSDIYDLVEWSIIDGVSLAVDNDKTYSTWKQGFIQVFQRFTDHKAFIQNIYTSLNLEHIQNYLYGLTYDLLHGVVEELAQGLDISQEDKEFIIQFYKYAFVGLVLDWFKTGMEKDPEIIVDKLAVLIEGNFNNGIQRFLKQ